MNDHNLVLALIQDKAGELLPESRWQKHAAGNLMPCCWWTTTESWWQGGHKTADHHRCLANQCSEWCRDLLTMVGILPHFWFCSK